MLSVFEFSVGIEGFVIGLGQISFFFSSYKTLLLYIFLVIKSHLNYAVFCFFQLILIRILVVGYHGNHIDFSIKPSIET